MMALISPPAGMNVFVFKGVAPDVPMRDIDTGILPFWLAMMICVVVLVAFPQVSLFLRTPCSIETCAANHPAHHWCEDVE